MNNTTTNGTYKLATDESIPIAVIFSIILLAGIAGNSIVLVVYTLRFKRTTSAILILTLAAFDLLTCLFGIPFHIYNTLYPLAFVWNGLCKVFSFVLTFSIVTSLLVLDIIAYDRYKRICNPHDRHLSPKQTRLVSFLIIVFSGAFSIPMLIVYGTSSREVGDNIFKVCFILEEFSGTVFHDIYDGLISVVYILPILILTGFHVPVVRRIWKLRDSKHKLHNFESTYRVKKRNAFISSNGGDLKVENRSGSSDIIEQHTIQNGSNSKDGITTKSSNLGPEKETMSGEKLINNSHVRNSTENEMLKTSRENDSPKKSNKRVEPGISQKKKRITIMFIVITVVFITSYLPYLIFKLLGGHDPDFIKSITSNQFIGYDFLTRLYFVSSVINPFVYWLLNQKFKDEVKALLRNFTKCICKQ